MFRTWQIELIFVINPEKKHYASSLMIVNSCLHFITLAKLDIIAIPGRYI
jgi:hypothetical protein